MLFLDLVASSQREDSVQVKDLHACGGKMHPGWRGVGSVLFCCCVWSALFPLSLGSTCCCLSTDLSLHMAKRWPSVCKLLSELVPVCLGASPTACSSIFWAQEISHKACVRSLLCDMPCFLLSSPAGLLGLRDE